MTTKNKASTIQGWKNGGDRLPAESPNVLTPEKRYVKNCPWDHIVDIFNCGYLPDNYLCGSMDCWDLGETARGFNVIQLTEEEFDEYVTAVIFVDSEVIHRLLEKYKDPPNPEDFLP